MLDLSLCRNCMSKNVYIRKPIRDYLFKKRIFLLSLKHKLASNSYHFVAS